MSVAVLGLFPLAGYAQRSSAWASSQFAIAQQRREELEQKPEAERTRHDYQRALNSFRAVYMEAPASSKADPSAFATGELLDDMGRRFHDDTILRSAIEQYEFLAREYPGSWARVQALLNTAAIYRELEEIENAKDTYKALLRKYPGSPLAEDARQALGELAKAAKAGRPSRKARKVETTARVAPVSPDNSESEKADRSPEGRKGNSTGAVSGGQPTVSEIAPSTPTHVTGVRFWSNPEYTRIAIDLDQDVRYESQMVEGPTRIVFDLQGAILSSPLTASIFDVNDGILKRIRVAQYKPEVTRIVLEPEVTSKVDAFLLANPARLILVIPRPKAAQSATAAGVDTPPTKRIVEADDDGPVTLKARVKPAHVDLGDSADPQKPLTKLKGSAAVAGREAAPTSAGNRSLIRALGLKIGRIVIDPGHGGHDTGTIGSEGLYEKDVVLDISQRLGRLLQARLAADVIFTRNDDSFIPLEERTAIANRELADLFVSIHANSSTDTEARGVETYYLNFSSSPEALEVAARENASSEKSIHELQDLVKKIALKDKIEESREFAADVQQSLYSGVSARNAAIHDRGVKKAPFVVLIGANMPSILAEISFLSNPEDEQRLGSAAYRQKIAQSLYLGISRYVNGLSGVKVASKLDKTQRQ